MSAKNFIIGSIVGAVCLFLLGWLIYGVLLADQMEMDLTMGWREPDLVFLFLSELCFAMMFTVAIGWTKAADFKSGAVTAAIVGLLFALTFSFSMYAFRTDYEFSMMAMDTVITVIRAAIVGGIVALVLSKMS